MFATQSVKTSNNSDKIFEAEIKNVFLFSSMLDILPYEFDKLYFHVTNQHMFIYNQNNDVLVNTVLDSSLYDFNMSSNKEFKFSVIAREFIEPIRTMPSSSILKIFANNSNILFLESYHAPNNKKCLAKFAIQIEPHNTSMYILPEHVVSVKISPDRIKSLLEMFTDNQIQIVNIECSSIGIRFSVGSSFDILLPSTEFNGDLDINMPESLVISSTYSVDNLLKYISFESSAERYVDNKFIEVYFMNDSPLFIKRLYLTDIGRCKTNVMGQQLIGINNVQQSEQSNVNQQHMTNTGQHYFTGSEGVVMFVD